MKTLINKKLYPYIVLTIFICTTFFYISNKVESNIFFRIIEVFFSIYILLVISLGVYKGKKNNKNTILTLLANGIIIYTIYSIKLFNAGITLDLKEYLTLIVSFISMILLYKIHIEENNKKNVA
jgi:cellulose synthase/poly-beta-1,6-N-acetylglucosamine synthase-like glycosyltransferase|tara:strand:+ start:916 stop:1287 length:372 start_codon:yes stop_codon:yes gene_type:complete